MNEINEPCNCLFIIKKNRNANLTCELSVEENKNIRLLSFNTTQFVYKSEYNISFVNLSQIYLINEDKLEGKKINLGLLLGLLTGAIIIIVILIIVINVFLKEKKNQMYEKVHNNKHIKKSWKKIYKI